MDDRRRHPRLLCADLVQIRWSDAEGHAYGGTANLEDISVSGVCLQVEQPVPLSTKLTVYNNAVEYEGTITYCIYREIGFFIGIEFDSSSRWSIEQFSPAHLLDPTQLVQKEAALPQRSLRRSLIN